MQKKLRLLVAGIVINNRRPEYLDVTTTVTFVGLLVRHDFKIVEQGRQSFKTIKEQKKRFGLFFE